jgi:adenylate cyclase
VGDPYRFRAGAPASRRGVKRNRLWPTYAGITALLLFIVIALAGGIIWYDSKKSTQLAIASAERLMQEVDEKTIDRIRLLYDPIYAIVGISSLVPDLRSPGRVENPSAEALLLRGLRIYPQILSLYVGFDSGDFLMITHIAGDKAEFLRKQLKAPPEAVFAKEIITAAPGGHPTTQWAFLAEDGAVISRQEGEPYNPRTRPWFKAAKGTDVVQRSDLYVFASNAEPGFTLSRSFGGATPGVMGADLAAVDLANFLRQQQITPGSTAFIFTKTGEIVAFPDQRRLAKALRVNGELKAVPAKVADLDDPVISGLVAAHQNAPQTGSRVYDVAGRTFIGRVVDIPPRYGHNQLLAIAVPVDEIEQPIAEIRNDTLLYSIAFVVFALPLFVTLVVVLIDRKFEKPAPWARFREEE